MCSFQQVIQLYPATCFILSKEGLCFLVVAFIKHALVMKNTHSGLAIVPSSQGLRLTPTCNHCILTSQHVISLVCGHEWSIIFYMHGVFPLPENVPPLSASVTHRKHIFPSSQDNLQNGTYRQLFTRIHKPIQVSYSHSHWLTVNSTGCGGLDGPLSNKLPLVKVLVL